MWRDKGMLVGMAKLQETVDMCMESLLQVIETTGVCNKHIPLLSALRRKRGAISPF